MFITVLTTALCPHSPNFLGTILNASFHLCPGLYNNLYFSLPQHNAYEFLLAPIRATCSVHLSHYMNNICWREISWSSSLWSFLQSPVTAASTLHSPHPICSLNTTDTAPHNSSRPGRGSVQHRQSTLTVDVTKFVTQSQSRDFGLPSRSYQFRENLSRPGIIHARARYRPAARRLRNTGIEWNVSWKLEGVMWGTQRLAWRYWLLQVRMRTDCTYSHRVAFGSQTLVNCNKYRAEFYTDRTTSMEIGPVCHSHTQNLILYKILYIIIQNFNFIQNFIHNYTKF